MSCASWNLRPLISCGSAAAIGTAIYFIYQRSRRQRLRGTHKEDAAARDARLREVLTPLEHGITVYWAGESPCARRVLITLREKGLEYKNCVISLLHGEQRHPAFLKINPQGKVPVLVCHGVHGVEDCTIFESAAIVTWLDEAFPHTKQLLPSSRALRREARLWQYWELSIAEEFWPLSRMQVDGVLWRWGYSRSEFEKVKNVMGAGDPFYTSKITNICQGTYLSPPEMLRHQIRIVRGFAMLERALKDGRSFLVGDAFSIADVSVLPRLLKAPINGILATDAQRESHKNVCLYFEKLRMRPSLIPFRRADDATWKSGWGCYILSAAGFGPSWLDGLPWWILVLIGNWRHGVQCQRLSWQDAASPEEPHVLADVLHAIPRPQLLAPARSMNSEWVLHADEALPLCTAVRIVLDSLAKPPCSPQAKALPHVRVNFINHTLCHNFSRSYLECMPWGELPSLVDVDGAVVYGPMNIAEFACEEAAMQGGTMMPDSPKARAIVRRWAGWARTGWHYQLMPLYWRDVAGPALLQSFGSDRASLARSLSDALGDHARVEIDALVALQAYDQAHAKSDGNAAGNEDAYGAHAEPELLMRCRFVNNELRHVVERGGKYLAGGYMPTAADAFVAPFCTVALSQYVPASAQGEFSALHTWLTQLRQEHPVFDAHCSALVQAWGFDGSPDA